MTQPIRIQRKRIDLCQRIERQWSDLHKVWLSMELLIREVSHEPDRSSIFWVEFDQATHLVSEAKQKMISAKNNLGCLTFIRASE